jgi:hypothetical protein
MTVLSWREPSSLVQPKHARTIIDGGDRGSAHHPHGKALAQKRCLVIAVPSGRIMAKTSGGASLVLVADSDLVS